MADIEPVGRSHRLSGVRPVGNGRRAPRPADPEAGSLRRLVAAVGGLYDRAVDAVLATPHDVMDQRHALRLLDERGREGDALREQIAKVAVLAMPVVRRLQTAGRVARAPGLRRLPFVASVTTAATLGTSLTRGVRDVQVLGSYVASRLREASGMEPDPELVKRLTVQFYLAPSDPPRLDQRIGSARLVRRWLLRGVFGRDSRRAAEKAIGSIARMDPDRTLASWRAHGGR